MKRHRVGQGTIAVEDVSSVAFFGWSKDCHNENRWIVARVPTEHNRFREKRIVAEFLLILDAFPG